MKTFKGQEINGIIVVPNENQIWSKQNGSLIRIVQVVTGLHGNEPISCDVEFENRQITNIPIFMFESGELEYIGYVR